jgi:nucleoside-diphosphate-sugar epimerase
VLVPLETYEWVANLAWVKDVGFACALACDPRKHTVHNAYNVAFDNVTFGDLLDGIARALGTRADLHPVPFEELPEGASPYGPMPSRHAGYDIAAARRDLGFEPSALEDALAETLAWYRVARPSHAGYANRQKELEIARRT